MKSGGFIFLSLLAVVGCSSQVRHPNTKDQLSQQSFRAGHEYNFNYNGQLASGLMVGQETQESEQTAATRIQTQVQIVFHTEHEASLRLKNVRVGYLNEPIEEPQQVQPMGKFEQKTIEEEKRTKLQHPVHFKYVQGVVESIQFHSEDSAWSKNIKRSVLNMIQLNMNKNNAQRQLERSSEEENDVEGGQIRYKSFTIPEITIEGECQTTYAINQAQPQNKWQEKSTGNQNGVQFNVTKSINFNQCTKVADIGYGFQTQQQQPEWTQCQKQWEQQQQQTLEGKRQQQQLDSPCDRYDPKEIKQQKVDRSTVLRFQLNGKPEKYGIQRVELVSHYVFKNLQSENSRYGAAMHTIVSSNLVFLDSKQSKQERSFKSSASELETLLYSNEWDLLEKRFYMTGDEGFARDSPFRSASNKAEQAQQILRKLIQSATDKTNGIEAEIAIQLQRLVELLRMCSVEELQRIYNQLTQSGTSSRSEAEQQRAEHLLADSLAIAGTRNTIFVLVEKILSKDISSAKAVQALKNLKQLPAPSHQQADILLKLCRNELAHRSPALKQSCWLTFGSIVGELCQQGKVNVERKQQAFGSQTGFPTEKMCSQQKKEQYQQALFEQYEKAETTHEKVLALKAIGNAGLESFVESIQKIINDQTQEPIIRITAIDSLRRLRNQIPQKIQRVLLPIYQNVQEQSRMRMAAFAMIMHTQPEQYVLDQMTYALSKENCEQVKSFVYTTMQTLSQSKVPSQQQLAQHLKNGLKLANIDELELQGSRKYQIPIFSQDQGEGAILDFVSVFSGREMLPAHLSASLHTLLNDEFEINALKVSVSQQELDRWYEQLITYFTNVGSDNSQKTRGQRKSASTSQRRGEEEIQQIYSSLGIKNRQSFQRQQQQKNGGQQSQQQFEEFAILNIRVGDVDQVIVPVSLDTAPQYMKEMIRNGEKPSLSHLESFVKSMTEPKHLHFVFALNLNEKTAKIPTSMGIPLRILQAAPVVGSFDGHIKINLESGGLKAHITANPSVVVSHIQKMETWLPIINTGVESFRAVEANVATQMVITASREEGLKLSIKTPTAPKTTVFGIHSLPTTFTRDYDNKNNMHREPKVKAVHQPQLEQHQHDVNLKVGEHSLGLPFMIHGHYHWPADVTDYKQLVQLAMATENHVHVSFEPSRDSPRDITIQINGGSFQKIQSGSSSHKPQLQNFYSNAGNSESAYPEDFEDMQLEKQDKRRKNLENYIAKYEREAGQMYKHGLKMIVQTEGGRKQTKLTVQLENTCDAKFKFCKLITNVERSPMFADESTEWVLHSQIQIVNPEIHNTVEEMEQQQEKNKKFFLQAETQWGPSGRSQQQNINLRIQGECAQRTQWRNQISEFTSSSERQLEQKRVAFLNKYDVVADYKLQSSTQNSFNTILELLKNYNFWNTQTEFQQETGRDGQLVATVVIDPFTQQHANITMKTPFQKIRMQSMQLPIQMRPFALVSRQPEQSVHSISQVLGRWSTQGRAECKVDGKRVETFDEVLYKAPLSKCYSVLAKDCSSEQPKFVVLMKKLNMNEQDKKIQVLSRENIIECQPRGNGQSKKLECKLNGEVVESSNAYSSSENQMRNIVDYTNEDQEEVTINVEGVSVRFTCEFEECKSQKATIKISQLYKNGQCGLCGHYDDEAENELRMNNDDLTQNLVNFHRSYSFQDNKECSTSEQNEFYSSKNHENFSMESRQNDDDEDEQDNQEEEERNNGWNRETSSEEELKWNRKSYGQQQRQQQQKRLVNNNKQNGNLQRSNEQQESEEPIMLTKVAEYNHKICFSTEAVKQCPVGTTSVDSDYVSGSDDEETSRASSIQKTKVSFVCMNRSSVQARQYQREARRGVILDLSKETPSFVEPIAQPTRCMPY